MHFPPVATVPRTVGPGTTVTDFFFLQVSLVQMRIIQQTWSHFTANYLGSLHYKFSFNLQWAHEVFERRRIAHLIYL
jgi:hypothetical protein